jgi:hypothetical protein
VGAVPCRELDPHKPAIPDRCIGDRSKGILGVERTPGMPPLFCITDATSGFPLPTPGRAGHAATKIVTDSAPGAPRHPITGRLAPTTGQPVTRAANRKLTGIGQGAHPANPKQWDAGGMQTPFQTPENMR